MQSTKTILLTGGTGYLGSNLLKKLLPDYNLLLTTRSASNTWRIADVLDKVHLINIDEVSLDQIFEAEEIQVIVHCATNYGRKEPDPLKILDSNLIFALKMLELGSRSGVRCFINTDTVLDKRMNYYALSKNQFKQWLKVYADKITCMNVSLDQFYGPHDDESKFSTFIIRNILNKVERIDLTEGKQKRDFIFIDDLVNAILKVIDHSFSLDKGYFNYEIGTSKNVSIRDFVILVKDLAGNTETNLNFSALPYRKNEVMESNVDITEIKKLAWQPEFTLEQGLQTTIDQERKTL